MYYLHIEVRCCIFHMNRQKIYFLILSILMPFYRRWNVLQIFSALLLSTFTYAMKEENYCRRSYNLKFFLLGNLLKCILQQKELHGPCLPPTACRLEPEMGGMKALYFSSTPKSSPSTDAIYQISKARVSWIWKILNIQIKKSSVVY